MEETVGCMGQEFACQMPLGDQALPIDQDIRDWLEEVRSRFKELIAMLRLLGDNRRLRYLANLQAVLPVIVFASHHLVQTRDLHSSSFVASRVEIASF